MVMNDVRNRQFFLHSVTVPVAWHLSVAFGAACGQKRVAVVVNPPRRAKRTVRGGRSFFGSPSLTIGSSRMYRESA